MPPAAFAIAGAAVGVGGKFLGVSAANDSYVSQAEAVKNQGISFQRKAASLRYSKQVAENNQEILRVSSYRKKTEAHLKSLIVKRRAEKEIGRARVNRASLGIENTGSAIEVDYDSLLAKELDLSTVKHQGEVAFFNEMMKSYNEGERAKKLEVEAMWTDENAKNAFDTLHNIKDASKSNLAMAPFMFGSSALDFSSKFSKYSRSTTRSASSSGGGSSSSSSSSSGKGILGGKK